MSMAWGLSTLQCLGGTGGTGAAGRCPSAPVTSLQPPEDDAAIVGAVRLFSVLIAAVTMDLAGRKVLLFVSGELRCHLLPTAAAMGCAPRHGRVWLGALGSRGRTCPGDRCLPRAWPAPAALEKGPLGLV